jgi:hypothetical protein
VVAQFDVPDNFQKENFLKQRHWLPDVHSGDSKTDAIIMLTPNMTLAKTQSSLKISSSWRDNASGAV